MIRGIYNGPFQAVSLNGADYTLTPGATVELPDCEYTSRLIACGFLTVTAAKAKKGDK